MDEPHYIDQPGKGREGLIVSNHGVNGFGRDTIVLLHTGYGETIDISRFVAHITTETPVRGIITHDVRFYQGVLPHENAERAALAQARRDG